MLRSHRFSLQHVQHPQLVLRRSCRSSPQSQEALDVRARFLLPLFLLVVRDPEFLLVIVLRSSDLLCLLSGGFLGVLEQTGDGRLQALPADRLVLVVYC
jgi:hypothetical protein